LRNAFEIVKLQTFYKKCLDDLTANEIDQTSQTTTTESEFGIDLESTAVPMPNSSLFCEEPKGFIEVFW